jgi:hypothetical protein
MRASAVLIGSLYLVAAPLLAQTSASRSSHGTSVQASSCVDVTVNDRPALSYGCLNQQLAASADTGGAPQSGLDAVAHAPSNQQAGQFNFSALSIRMGNNLGKSVYPQRPPQVLVQPLFGKPPATH